MGIRRVGTYGGGVATVRGPDGDVYTDFDEASRVDGCCGGSGEADGCAPRKDGLVSVIAPETLMMGAV